MLSRNFPIYYYYFTLISLWVLRLCFVLTPIFSSFSAQSSSPHFGGSPYRGHTTPVHLEGVRPAPITRWARRPPLIQRLPYGGLAEQRSSLSLIPFFLHQYYHRPQEWTTAPGPRWTHCLEGVQPPPNARWTHYPRTAIAHPVDNAVPRHSLTVPV